MHSPNRKVTVKEQQEWKIPPCISNWKNAKVYILFCYFVQSFRFGLQYQDEMKPVLFFQLNHFTKLMHCYYLTLFVVTALSFVFLICICM